MAGVCLSVCPVPDPKSITEGRRKLKIGRKEAHDMGDPWSHLEVENSKVKSLGRPTPWPKTSHIFGSGRPTNYKLDVWSTSSDDPRHRHARWPPSWRLWVAVTCRGRGHIVPAPLYSLLIILTVFCVHWMLHHEQVKPQVRLRAALTDRRGLTADDNADLSRCDSWLEYVTDARCVTPVPWSRRTVIQYVSMLGGPN